MASTNGKRPIDLIKATFDGSRRSMTWPGTELVLFFPPLTPARWAKAQAMVQAAGKDITDTNELGIRLLIVTAQTEDESPAFQVGDYNALRNSTKVTDLQEIVNFMTETGPAVLSDAGVTEAEALVAVDPI